jgi:WD40 repeat protein
VYGESPHTSPERAVLQGHTEWVWTVAVSSDGGMAVSASRDGTLRVWDIEAAVATPPEARHQHTVIQVIFSTDGQRVASGSLDGTVRIWDGSTGNALPVLERHEASVTACAFVPRSRQVATGCDDGSVHLWDAESGTVRWSRSPMAEDPEWHGYEPAVWALRVTRDGGAVLTAHNDGRVRIWDALDGILRADLQASETRSVALFCEVSPDDHHVLTWVQGVEPPLLWSLDKAEVVARLEGHTNWALWGGFSPDGTRIAITDSGGVLRLWDGRSGAAVSILEGHSKGMACAFSPDGHRLASASADGTIRLWDAVTGQALRAVSVEHPLGFVAYSADGSLLATLADTGWLDVWNAESLDLVCRYPGSATAMAWSPTEGTLALGAADGRFVLLRPDQGLPHPARTAAGNDAS